MNQKENVASALGSILLGILLIVMKGKIITAAITLLAVFVIVGAIMDFVAGLVNYGIVKSVAGICILVFGWVFASLAFYILAAGIIIMGLLQISSIKKTMPVNLTAVSGIFQTGADGGCGCVPALQPERNDCVGIYCNGCAVGNKWYHDVGWRK